MGFVIDTSALVFWERHGWFTEDSLITDDDELVMPAIVWAEALVGVRLADTAERAARRRARLEAIRNVIGVEAFTPEIAEHYAAIFAELTHAGTPIPQNDLGVAATARAQDLGVIVGPNDEAHFRLVRNLDIRVLKA